MISHEEGDEGDQYGKALRTLALQSDVDLRFVPVATDPATGQAQAWIDDPSAWEDAAEHNFEVGRRSFSFEVAQGVVDRAIAGFDS